VEAVAELSEVGGEDVSPFDLSATATKIILANCRGNVAIVTTCACTTKAEGSDTKRISRSIIKNRESRFENRESRIEKRKKGVSETTATSHLTPTDIGVRHGVSKRIEEGHRPIALGAVHPCRKGVSGVACLQGVEGSGMVGPSDTSKNPWAVGHPLPYAHAGGSCINTSKPVRKNGK
jgi:hypothetical protein